MKQILFEQLMLDECLVKPGKIDDFMRVNSESLVDIIVAIKELGLGTEEISEVLGLPKSLVEMHVQEK